MDPYNKMLCVCFLKPDYSSVQQTSIHSINLNFYTLIDISPLKIFLIKIHKLLPGKSVKKIIIPYQISRSSVSRIFKKWNYMFVLPFFLYIMCESKGFESYTYINVSTVRQIEIVGVALLTGFDNENHT